MIGVYWGAFDPPTSAHIAIIQAAQLMPNIEKIFVVLNNHSYKIYTYPLATRIQLLQDLLNSTKLKNISLLYQDDLNPLNYSTLKKLTVEPLCAIAGYDAYCEWLYHSTSEERALYQAIAVVPRGNDESPSLFDPHAFLLPIEEIYRHVSSTKARGHAASSQKFSV